MQPVLFASLLLFLLQRHVQSLLMLLLVLERLLRTAATTDPGTAAAQWLLSVCPVATHGLPMAWQSCVQRVSFAG